MPLAEVEKLIETALGLNLKGRDSLKVVEAKFYRPAVIPEDIQPAEETGLHRDCP